jgi:3-hydroxyisobutyrate dehydrogenase-like beta-hydroxyacid dehydrogenase
LYHQIILKIQIMRNNSHASNAVTVIGLGAMGKKIAQLYLANKYQVTVWNRTVSKAASLKEQGAAIADDIISAITASPLVIICVYDHKSSEEIFAQKDITSALGDKIVVQLTTGSPEDAQRAEKWFNERNAKYLDGAIQVAPDQMALPDTTILFSGKDAVFAHAKKDLSVLGGNLKYLGSKITLASAMDLATLSYVYGASMGFFHGVLVAESSGLSIAEYGSLVSAISPSFGQFFQHESEVIQKGDYTITQSPLSISVEAINRIKAFSFTAGINSDLPVLASKVIEGAANQGYANEEFAAVIKVLRK